MSDHREHAAEDDGRKRYFIVNTGRCGSTLLTVILADAGADFGLPTPGGWDPAGGDMEHPEIVRISRLFRRAAYIAPGKRYFLFYKYLADARRSLGKRRLRAVLERLHYAKADNLTLWIWHIAAMGYRPQIILSYRRFGPTARSYFLARGLSIERLATYYRRVNGDGLLMLDTYGGCAISYEELVDPEEVAWAGALAEITGLDRDRLLASRDRRLASDDEGGRATAAGENRLYDPGAEHLYRELRQLKGIAVPPSRQFLRIAP